MASRTLLTALLCVVAVPAQAGNETDTRAELAQIQSRILKVTEAVHAEAATRDEAAAALKSADHSLREARALLEEVRARKSAAEQKEAALVGQVSKAQHTLSTERDALAADLRSTYKGGRDESLKLWLNAKDPAEIARMMTYYGYFGRARSERIHAVESAIGQLQEAQAKLAEERQQIAALAAQQEEQVQGLNTAKSARARALLAVEADLDSKSSELQRLRANAASLEKLLAQLREALKDLPSEDFASAGRRQQAFSNLRGRLPWPARGTVLAQFGAAKPGGLLWTGLLMQTAPATAVHAVYYGRVIYADWLSGLGLLIIVDHGGGYLTLYGNNERLYRKVGDAVVPGDVIGTSAEAAGGMAAQMYFEVRHGKDALDPRTWLRPMPGSRNP